MGRIEKLFVAQAAERALTLVRIQHTLAKGPLVESNADHGSDVHAARAVGILAHLALGKRGSLDRIRWPLPRELSTRSDSTNPP